MTTRKENFECRGSADGRFSYAGSTPHYAPDRTFETRHIKLDLALDLSRKSLTGVCTVTLAALADPGTEVIFDAMNFQIRHIRIAGRVARYTYDKRKITLLLAKPVKRGQAIEVAIAYGVTRPKLGLHFIGPDRHYPSKPVQAWTQGEDEYNRYWFPCHDAPQERTTSEMIIRVPAGFTAISNGALLRRHRRGRSDVFHWKHDVPHSPYLVSLAVGRFSEIREQWGKVPVLYYCQPGREADARRAFGKTPKMLDFFSKKTGVPYPYAKYSQVAAVDFIYGGMENTSSTTQTALTLHDERAHLDFSSDPLVAHELAHQWFGDLVTCKDWSHAWLNESFATYFEALFKEFDLGYDEFIYELHENSNAYFDEDKERYRRPLVTKFYKNTNDLFDRHLYEKGSLILHMIRSTLGEEAWWRSINLYLKRHRTRGVETVDLIQAIQDATGKNLRPFFDQWVFKGGHPEFKVRLWWDARARKVTIRVLQMQTVNEETPLYSIPITFVIYAKGEIKRFAEKVDKKEHLFTYPLGTAPELVLFDPEHVILKKVDIVKPEEMWIYQLSFDPHVLGRLEAAEALGALASPTAIQALRQALFSEKFWAVQAGIARSMARTRASQALETLLEALRKIQHPKVRRALYEALGGFSHPQVLAEVRALHSTEKSYLVEAEAVRCLGRQREPGLIGLFKAYLERDSWNDVLRSAALEAIGSLQLAESLSILKEYSRYGHHPNVRMTAIRRLGLLGRGRPEVQEHLLELLADPYLLVQLAVVRSLAGFADERAAEPLMKYTSGELDGRLKRAAEEAVRKIRKGMEQEFPTKTA